MKATFRTLEELGFFVWLKKEVDTYMYLELLLCASYDGGYSMSEIVNALVFRWARNEHKLHPHICYFGKEQGWSVDIYNLANNMGLVNYPMGCTGYTSFEGAQSKAVEVVVDIVKLRK